MHCPEWWVPFLKRACKTSKFRPRSPGLVSPAPVPTTPMAGFAPWVIILPVLDYKPAVPKGTQEVLPCISLMHNCSYLVQDTSEGPKAANKPRFPYTSQRLKKIYSCPTTHFHQVGGTSVIQNWKDTGPKVSFSNSVSGIFSQSGRGGVAIEQLLRVFISYILTG